MVSMVNFNTSSAPFYEPCSFGDHEGVLPQDDLKNSADDISTRNHKIDLLLNFAYAT